MDLSLNQFFTVMNTKRNFSFLERLTAFLSDSVVQAVLGILILLAVSIIAYLYLSKLRQSTSGDTEFVDDLKKNFDEMRSGGDISEAEYRKISASLSGVRKPIPSPDETNATKS